MEEKEKDMTAMFNSLDALLNETDLKDVTAESTGFTELPDGYYLAEVEKVELTESKKTHLPMVAFEFKVVENGTSIDEAGEFHTIDKSKNRKVFMYYVLKDSGSLTRFVADMLKFEGDVAGEPILDKECFTNSALLVDALDILAGLRIYVQISTTENDDGTSSSWKNLISWKRVADLELPQ